MQAFFDNYVNQWSWFTLGVVLVVLEVFAPGAVLIWMGVAAFLVGIVVWLTPIGWEWQLLIFSLLSIASIVGWRLYLKRSPTETDHPTLNRRSEQYIDRVLTLEQPIVNGTGRIHVDDSYWRVRGEDAEAGTRVRVTGVDGTTLIVEAADAGR